MGLFDKDPKYQQLKAIRDSGYKGWVDNKGNKVKDVGKWVDSKQSGKKK